MRTRGNGQPLSAHGIIEDAVLLGEFVGTHKLNADPTDLFELQKDITELIRREVAAARRYDAAQRVALAKADARTPFPE